VNPALPDKDKPTTGVDIDPRELNMDVYLKKDPYQSGYIKIVFDIIEDFIQPISYTKSVTNFSASSDRLMLKGAKSRSNRRRGVNSRRLVRRMSTMP
jgi:hypothetical protein